LVQGPVLELIAGTGMVSIPLIEAGVDLTCEDSSQEMLAILDHELRSRKEKNLQLIYFFVFQFGGASCV
jgi:hypothetical protein